jgi:pimeloyl-ACP methyl ester carboxylesterase
MAAGRPTVVLVHGLWMPAASMRLLAHRLSRHGFATQAFSYPSVRDDPHANARRLLAFVREPDTGQLHLVGHSLGGRVILEALAQRPLLPPGRVVLLGTPVEASRVARGLARSRAGRWMLGASRHSLLRRALEAPEGRDLGVVAGTLSFGFGRWLTSRLPHPNDGTVSAAETVVPGMKSQLLLPVSHTGLLFSRRVARAVALFINSGSFEGA